MTKTGLTNPPAPPTEGLRLQHLLQQVNSMQIHYQSNRSGATVSGAGKVIVSRAGSAIRFLEHGHWGSPPERVIPYRNAVIWAISENSLELSHARNGWEHPTLLATFELTGCLLLAGSPHTCAEDCYAATLTIGEKIISLDWTITGPKKDDRLSIDYL